MPFKIVGSSQVVRRVVELREFNVIFFGGSGTVCEIKKENKICH